MLPDINNIARRIKELRDINGVSIETLSREFQISVEDYKKYESGETDIPIGFLFRVAGKFDVDMTALLTGEEPRLKLYSVVRKNKGVSTDRRKEYKYQDLAYNFINKKAEVFLVTVDPRNDGQKPDSYSHDGQEFNFVIEGSLKVFIGPYEVILEEGDSLYFNSGQNHAMLSLNNKPARFLAVVL
ncbi:MAG: cupin domain-containing protein [Brevinematales bacterium]|jgi:transcriptional regulator with XRE-family HTH domain